jgi:hypothetical protein
MVVTGSAGFLATLADVAVRGFGVMGTPMSESPHSAVSGWLGTGAGSLSGGELGLGMGELGIDTPAA